MIYDQLYVWKLFLRKKRNLNFRGLFQYFENFKNCGFALKGANLLWETTGMISGWGF